MPDQTSDAVVYSTKDCAKAPLNGRWVFKLSVITLIVFLVGAWGFWDASSVYPARGQRYAEWAKWQYLEQAKNADAEDFGIFVRESSIADPVAEFASLEDPTTKARNLADAADSSKNRTLRASMYVARLNWLSGLRVIGHLDPEYTKIDSPQSTLNELRTLWKSAPQPKPLHALDLIVQWLIMGVCWVIALLMFVHMLKVRAMRYSWDSATMTMTIPGGAKITPDDLEEVDKRKWEKFIVFLKIKGDHPTLGGKEISVDTYQHRVVEDWILAMEEQAFGSQEDDDDTDSSTETSPDSSAQPTTESDDQSA